MEKEMNQNTPQAGKPQSKPTPGSINTAMQFKGDGLDLTSAQWRDMIFQGKNKEFGAYQLRATSDRRHNFATLYTIIGLVVVALGIWLWSIYNDYLEQERIAREQAEKMAQAKVADEAANEEDDEEIDVKYEEEMPEQEEVVETIAAGQAVILDQVDDKQKMQTQEALQQSNAVLGNETKEGTTTDETKLKNVANEIVTPKEDKPEPPKPQPAKEEIFKAVEQMPEYPGGQQALMAWLSKNINYPQTALQNGVEGRVVVKFVVEKDGSVSDVVVVKGVDKDLDREAVRVVKKMPKWQPGKNNGHAVRCYYNLPVTFKIQQ